MQLGTIFVLIGAILFFIALLMVRVGTPRRWFFGVHTVLAVAGIFTTVGVLLGAPAIHVS